MSYKNKSLRKYEKHILKKKKKTTKRELKSKSNLYYRSPSLCSSASFSFLACLEDYPSTEVYNAGSGVPLKVGPSISVEVRVLSPDIGPGPLE